MFVKFTKSQTDLINHRLLSTDCLCEVFEDVYTPDEIEASVAKLSAMLHYNYVDFSDLNDCDRAMLVDTIEGSTWVACVVHATNAEYHGAARVMDNVVDKFRHAGLVIDNPAYY
jgi:hypothetical protein